MTSAVKIAAILTARPNKVDELWLLLDEMAPYCRAEPGNLRWDVWRDRSQHDRFVLDELYLDNSALAAHHDTPHYKNYLARIADLADRVVVVCDPGLVGT